MAWYWYVLIVVSPFLCLGILFLIGMVSWMWHYSGQKGMDDYERRKFGANDNNPLNDSPYGENDDEPEPEVKYAARNADIFEGYSKAALRKFGPKKTNP